MNKIYSDFHIHTTPVSPCAREDASPDNYLRLAKEQGLTHIGFSNHFWDSDVRIQKEDEWFYNMSFDNLYKIIPTIPNNLHGIKIYLGVEVDVDKDDIVGLAEKNFDKLDYILIATNHFHAKGFQVDKNANLDDINIIRKYQFSHYLKAVNFNFPGLKVICHPFIIHGVPPEKLMEFLRSITDEEYKYYFGLAVKTNTAIEIHSGFLNKKYFELDEAGFVKEYVRMFKIANEVGCMFTIGSDAHWMDMFHHDKYEPFINHVGIDSSRIIQELPESKLMKLLNK